MRRWTLLVVSHDTQAPRTYSVSDRMLRIVCGVSITWLVVGMVGLGVIVAQVDRTATKLIAVATAPPKPPPNPVADTLQARLGTLRGVLDSLEQLDESLSIATRSNPADSVILARVEGALPPFLEATAAEGPRATASRTADTLLDHARSLSARWRVLDSAARTRPRGNAPDAGPGIRQDR